MFYVERCGQEQIYNNLRDARYLRMAGVSRGDKFNMSILLSDNLGIYNDFFINNIRF